MIARAFPSNFQFCFYAIKAGLPRSNFINLDTSQKGKFIELKAQRCSQSKSGLLKAISHLARIFTNTLAKIKILLASSLKINASQNVLKSTNVRAKSLTIFDLFLRNQDSRYSFQKLKHLTINVVWFWSQRYSNAEPLRHLSVLLCRKPLIERHLN